MILHRLLQVLTGVLLGLAVVAVLFLRTPGEPRLAGPEAAYVPDPVPAPELALRTVDGDTVRLSGLRGEVALVFFGFANCPDVCPLTLARWSRALEELEARGTPFRGLFVSVDPERDTPEALGRWMSAFHPGLVAVTGTPEEIDATARAWNVHVRVRSGAGAAAAGSHAQHGEQPAGDPHAHHAPGDGPAASGGAQDLELPPPPAGDGAEDYLVEHSSRTFVVDRRGWIVRTFPAYLDADEIVSLLEPYLSR